MPIAFPTGSALRDAFSSASPMNAFQRPTTHQPRTKYEARPELYSAWSTVDDAKKKTAQLSDAAVKEFEKASSAAQAKAGKIELYSPKYYATCTLGGLLACVSTASSISAL
jgi:solute carrier family 25 phosphate transporter 3